MAARKRKMRYKGSPQNFKKDTYLFIFHYMRKYKLETLTKGGQTSVQLKAAAVGRDAISKPD